MPVEPDRIRPLNTEAPRSGSRYVLYWMQMNRRVESNHALAHAIELANQNGLPLLVYEGLTCTYRGANDRIHTFMLEAVPGTAAALKEIGAGYFFYLRARRDDPNDVLYRLAERALCVVTDDYPTFIASEHSASEHVASEHVASEHSRSVPNKLTIPFIAVDSSCIVPMSRHEKREYGAYTIRPKIKRELQGFLKPLALPRLKQAWAEKLLLRDLAALRTQITQTGIARLVGACEINHGVRPSPVFAGGYEAARERLEVFLAQRLYRYAKESNQPSRHATSELSPYIHFGQISCLEIALAVRDYAEEHRLIADEFLEELIVRRELAFNFVRFTPNYDSLDSLPDWCRRTMHKHAADRRPFLYRPEQFEAASTHDPLWNATQKELLITGKIHGYYRMYWGKKVIEWSPTYEDALRLMIHLHDVYALDGRDPNTYANILWCFGLHDRPWGERPVFGQLRYMSFDGMRRKTDTDAYIAEIAALERAG